MSFAPSSASLATCVDELGDFTLRSRLLNQDGSGYAAYRLTPTQTSAVELLVYTARGFERQSLHVQLENKKLLLELRQTQEELREAQKVADQFIADLDPDRG